jgi:hypothetical protein
VIELGVEVLGAGGCESPRDRKDIIKLKGKKVVDISSVALLPE